MIKIFTLVNADCKFFKLLEIFLIIHISDLFKKMFY